MSCSSSVSKKKDIEATAQALLKAAGSIDALVNNAGILKRSLLQDLDEANWDAHFDVNAKGVLMMCQAVLQHMRAKNRAG
ncbi:SDR family oxidoreductase [Mesorhizobium sp. VK3E]|uniref:SDR family oxidoreductase n=1 Tax=Mesorhizobium australafricanum TaxID=3072311 RepID=A0ABU4WV92_9HYPH|nr:SDR family oxidoreductase [Mesorhizobium sp. VK3E]MDX8438920.1 SDR family oxidoreductase [Mesorhizobium sp. VK3E]